MAENLTKAEIEKFVSAGTPADKSEAVLRDNAVIGLGLRMRTTGSCSWVLVYRKRKGAGRKERVRRVTLGSWPALTIDAARAAAKAMVGEIALRKDPAVELRSERNREQRQVSRALDDYERSLRRRKIVNVKAVMSTLRRGLARFAAREIDTLTRKDLINQIEALENAGKPGAATDLRSHARAWLEWAVSSGFVQFNVLAGLRRARSSRAERLDGKSKGKALSDPEIVALWNGVAVIGVIGAFGGLVRLGLLTGMRRRRTRRVALDRCPRRPDCAGGARDKDRRAARGSAHRADAQRAGGAAEDDKRPRFPIMAHGRPNEGLDGTCRRRHPQERRCVQAARFETNGSHTHGAARREQGGCRTRYRTRQARADRNL